MYQSNKILKRINKMYRFAISLDEETDVILRKMYQPTKKFIRQHIYDIFPDIKKKYIDRQNIQSKIYHALSNDLEYIQLLKKTLNKKLGDIHKYIRYFVATNILDIQDYCNRISERYNQDYKVERGPKKNLKERLFSLDIFKSLLNNEQYDKLLPYIFPKLREYIEQNFRQICKTLELKRYEYDLQSYESSWNDDITSLKTEQAYLKAWLRKYGMNVIEYVLRRKMDPEDLQEAVRLAKEHIYTLIDQFVESNNDIVVRIREYILNKNKPVRRQRAQNLLNADDDALIRRPNAIEINYDVSDDIIRDKPILIVRGKNDNKDYIFIGNTGDSHSRLLQTKVNIPILDNYWCQAYLLGYIAFVDEDNFIQYTQDEVINLLKNHPQIKKIYTIPNGEHRSTRLAKKI